MHFNMKGLINRAISIFRTEGFFPLIGRTFSFISNYVYRNERYSLRTDTMGDKDERDYLPKAQHCEVRILQTAQEAEALIADGYKITYSEGTVRRYLAGGQ